MPSAASPSISPCHSEIRMGAMPGDRLVFIVDDDEAVRDSLELLLESAGHLVKAFEAAADALEFCRASSPACIVTDVRMPEMDGLEFQERLAASGIQVPVIVMTGHADVPLAVRAMKAGAVDFIEKPFSDDAMLASIEAALKRRSSTIDPALMERLDSLTPREREVLELLVVGHPNKVIAHRLDISPRTVEIHRAHVMEKMKAKSLPELVRRAMQAGVTPSI
ncbi:MAG TPA: response regulator FixJ [Dongiaceae bacterium]|nr:response regulator FixJ [Dongiaceae bacterium]